MDFAHTRQENDQELLSRIDAIRCGEDLEVLEPFAKAYLGLFYDIDSHIAPQDRISLLANAELAEAITQGLLNVLQRQDLPTPEQIAKASLKQQIPGIGYAVLAGISLLVNKHHDRLYSLPEPSLQSAICFHHFISTFHDDNWYKPLLIEKSVLSAQALLSMWQELINEKNDFLPGLKPVLQDEALRPLFTQLVIPLLQIWRHCRHRDLSQLLSMALRYVDGEVLLETAKDMLSRGELLNLRNQVYWQATAFLLAPEAQGQNMLNFMGQEKIKLLPFLDFTIPLLEGKNGESFTLSAMGYAFMIRCLAQKFTPQIDMNDNLGEISQKVLWLFYQLACFSETEGAVALKSLRRVRVLKLYSDVFDAIADCQSQADRPDFPSFVKLLREEGRLRMKKNWHDVR